MLGLLIYLVRLYQRYHKDVQDLENNYSLLEDDFEIHVEATAAEIKTQEDQILQLKSGWVIEEDDLEWDCRLAAGGYGEVWKGKWALLPNQPVAIKKMFVNASNYGAETFDDQEISVLMQTSKHARIVMFFGAGQLQSSHIFLVRGYFFFGNNLNSNLLLNKQCTRTLIDSNSLFLIYL